MTEPQYWPDNLDLQIDPTYVCPGEKQCDVCNKSMCDCAHRRPKILPRIRIYDGKGRGLQAVTEESGKIAHHEGDLIGQISGELAPPGTYRNGWCIVMWRDDFYVDMQVEVAQVNCERISDIFKLMNHDLNPPVILDITPLNGVISRGERSLPYTRAIEYSLGFYLIDLPSTHPNYICPHA